MIEYPSQFAGSSSSRLPSFLRLTGSCLQAWGLSYSFADGRPKEGGDSKHSNEAASRTGKQKTASNKFTNVMYIYICVCVFFVCNIPVHISKFTKRKRQARRLANKWAANQKQIASRKCEDSRNVIPVYSSSFNKRPTMTRP